MKSFFNSKTKGFHSRFRKASKKLTDEYYMCSVQNFLRMILLTVSQENMLSCSFVVSNDANLEFSEDRREAREIETFYHLSKNCEWAKRNPTSKYNLYDRFEFSTLESLHVLVA